jgi:glutathione S-transferase
MSGQGPYFGQKAWFERYHAEKLPSAIERYRKEIKRVLGVVDSHLAKQGTDYLTGNKVTYADIMFIPYFKGLVVLAPEVSTSEFKNYEAWLERLMSRPAVAKVWANQSETLATAAAAQPPSQEAIDSQ